MRILVVEDEIKLANAIKRALELQTFAVDLCHDGSSGLDLALGEDFDLIILDQMLPGINGSEICEQLRNKNISTPILLLTAKAQLQDKITGLDRGADDYMTKPFSFEELFARIRALLRRPRNTAHATLSFRNVQLDPAHFTVTVNSKKVDISAKEFALLEYLMRNKNAVMSRDQIISHIWNYDANVLPTTVEVHIKNLRDKIDEGKTSIIKTIRGRGYTLRED
ncbi:MAG: response regulator transcription factor [Candidatus Levybacteria bacterium]|nr:response regulator transcription factor [Candidatus Levybacteria bacterium]